MEVRMMRTRIPPWLAPALLLVAIVIVWFAWTKPTLKAVALPTPGEATEAQATEVGEQLSAAVERKDYDEAVRLSKWLDERLEAQGKALAVPYSRIVELWCEMAGYGYEFCEEEKNEE